MTISKLLKTFFPKPRPMLKNSEQDLVVRAEETEANLLKLEKDLMHAESNPNCSDANEKIKFPDLIYKGIRQKTFKTTGEGLIITLDKLKSVHLYKIIDSRKFFRVAFIRVIWFPLATDLPGRTSVSFLDLRAKEESQIVDTVDFDSNHMSHFSYMQDIYIHKSEISKMAISVKLRGHENKYPDLKSILGHIRIYWLIQSTNMPTQHNIMKAKTNKLSLMRMPSFREEGINIKQIKKFEADFGDSNENEIVQNLSPRESVHVKQETGQSSQFCNTREVTLKLDKEVNFQIPSDLNESQKQLIREKVFKTIGFNNSHDFCNHELSEIDEENNNITNYNTDCTNVELNEQNTSEIEIKKGTLEIGMMSGRDNSSFVKETLDLELCKDLSLDELVAKFKMKPS